MLSNKGKHIAQLSRFHRLSAVRPLFPVARRRMSFRIPEEDEDCPVAIVPGYTQIGKHKGFSKGKPVLVVCPRIKVSLFYMHLVAGGFTPEELREDYGLDEIVNANEMETICTEILSYGKQFPGEVDYDDIRHA